MYITGGIGSTSAGEAFTVDYDLAERHRVRGNLRGDSLFMFATRMTLRTRTACMRTRPNERCTTAVLRFVA